MIAKISSMIFMGMVLLGQSVWANPPRYYQHQIAYQGYFREHPTIITHYESSEFLAQIPYYTPSDSSRGYPRPYAPPVGDIVVVNSDEPKPQVQETEKLKEVVPNPNTKTILYSSECVTVCPLPQDPNVSSQFPQMQQ